MLTRREEQGSVPGFECAASHSFVYFTEGGMLYFMNVQEEGHIRMRDSAHFEIREKAEGNSDRVILAFESTLSSFQWPC